MVIVSLTGGLGNQLFLYSVGRSIAERTGKGLYLDTSIYPRYWSRSYQLNHFNIKGELIKKSSRNQVLKAAMLVKDERGVYFDNLDTLDAEVIHVEGYWQSYLYLQKIKNLLQQEIRVKVHLAEQSERVLNSIKETNSVAVHLRRGDYYAIKKTRKKYGSVCDEEYYFHAIEYVASRIEAPIFYIFSDDIEYAQKLLSPLKYNFRFVSSSKSFENSSLSDNYFFRNINIIRKRFVKNNDHVDFELMRHCKHYIIANSSFSWWPAWLSDYPLKIVCCPARWTTIKTPTEESYYRMLIPEDWVRIS